MLKDVCRSGFEALLRTTRRFPLSVLFCIVFFVLGVAAHIQGKEHWFAPLFFGYLLFLSIKLAAESCQWRLPLAYGAGVAIMCAIELIIATSSYVLPFIYLSSGLALLVFVSPYLFMKNVKELAVWSFVYRVGLRLALAVVAAVVLFFGLAAILSSLNFLLGIKIEGWVYFDVWFSCVVLFAPLFTMAGIPLRFDEEEASRPEGVRILLSSILVPLLSIYAVILYIYIAKITAMWTLPKGGVVYLVSGFGITGVFVCLAGYPWRDKKNAIAFFSKWFPLALLIPLVLMAVGIAERIKDYGVTEGRYTVLLCLVWLSLSVLLALRKRGGFSPRAVLGTAAVLLLITSFGPWGGESLSQRSQMNRLYDILTRNALLVNDRIQKPTAQVSHADQANISAIVEYMVQTKKDNALKPWFQAMPQAYLSRNADDKKRLALFAPKAIIQDMGIEYVSEYERSREEKGLQKTNHFFFALPRERIVPSDGFDYFVSVYLMQKGTNNSNKFSATDGKTPLEVTLIGNVCKVTFKDGQTLVFDLGDFVKRKTSDESVPLFVESQGANMKARLMIQNLSGTYADESKTEPNVTSLGGFLLIKNDAH